MEGFEKFSSTLSGLLDALSGQSFFQQSGRFTLPFNNWNNNGGVNLTCFQKLSGLDYPEKVLFAPSHKIFTKKSKLKLFDREENIFDIWNQLENNK